MTELNATAAALLGLLHDGEMTGWDVLRTAQDSIANFWTLTPSQVYRELSRMASDGLLEAGERGARSKQPFAITEAGRAAFAAWLDDPPREETIRYPLMLAVIFSARLPRERLAEIAAAEHARHAARLTGYLERRAELEAAPEPPLPALTTLDFGIAHERAAVSWLEDLRVLREDR